MRPRALKSILQLPLGERLDAIAEGLGLLAEHVREVRADVVRLDDGDGLRGLAILQAQLDEEAAKSLILLDLVRMGWSDQTAASRQIGYFSNHLPRCIYAEMVDMSPATFGEVRDIVESLRPSLYLDGPSDVDWIFRNQLIAEREQTLYVDVKERFGATSRRLRRPLRRAFCVANGSNRESPEAAEWLSHARHADVREGRRRGVPAVDPE